MGIESVFLGHGKYHGDVMERCLGDAAAFAKAAAVVVSGAPWNPCGHMLLNVGGCGGWYFHIAEVQGLPRAMGALGFQRYLRENAKREVGRVAVPLKEPLRAMARLEQLLVQRWTWFVLPHNCVRFVEVVLQAGGAPAGWWSNCPLAEVFH
jgi:hypothetical protein